MTKEEENREKEITHAAELEYFITKAEEFAWIHGAEWADNHPRKGLWDAEKVCKWLSERISIDQKIEIDSNGEPLADSYIAYCMARQNAADTIIKALRKAMED